MTAIGIFFVEHNRHYAHFETRERTFTRSRSANEGSLFFCAIRRRHSAWFSGSTACIMHISLVSWSLRRVAAFLSRLTRPWWYVSRGSTCDTMIQKVISNAVFFSMILSVFLHTFALHIVSLPMLNTYISDHLPSNIQHSITKPHNMSSTIPSTHIHIYNSGHPSSSATPASGAATDTNKTPKDSTTPLSEPQTLSAPITLVQADALKVKATSSETKSNKKPKIVQDGPTTVKVSTPKYDSDDSDDDDSSSDDDDDKKRKKSKESHSPHD